MTCSLAIDARCLRSLCPRGSKPCGIARCVPGGGNRRPGPAGVLQHGQLKACGAPDRVSSGGKHRQERARNRPDFRAPVVRARNASAGLLRRHSQDGRGRRPGTRREARRVARSRRSDGRRQIERPRGISGRAIQMGDYDRAGLFAARGRSLTRSRHPGKQVKDRADIGAGCDQASISCTRHARARRRDRAVCPRRNTPADLGTEYDRGTAYLFWLAASARLYRVAALSELWGGPQNSVPPDS